MLSSIFVVAFPLTIITISYSKTIRTFTARQREKREQKLRRRAEQRARDEEERARFLFSNPLNRTGTFKSQRVNDAVDTAGKEGKEDRRPRDGVPLETSHTLHSDETIAPNPTSATGPPHDESDEEHHIGPRGLIALRDSPPPQPVTPMFNTKFAATATVLKAVKALKGLSHSHPHSHSHSSFLSLHDDAPLEPRGSELAQRFTASPDGVPGTVEVRIVDWCYRGKGSVAGEEGEEGESEAFMGMPGSELRGRNDTLTVRVAVKDADHFARVMRALGEA
ncbi:hypothetical protein HK101_011158 [Irineochytrium annulatum]|nr:hypothetical protein HK101_011158 [Irineochytrium annulatum]